MCIRDSRSTKGDLGISGTYQIRVTLRDAQTEQPEEDQTPEENAPDQDTGETAP